MKRFLCIGALLMALIAVSYADQSPQMKGAQQYSQMIYQVEDGGDNGFAYLFMHYDFAEAGQAVAMTAPRQWMESPVESSYAEPMHEVDMFATSDPPSEL